MGDNLRLSSKQVSITAGKAYYKKHADEINSTLVSWVLEYVDVKWHSKYKVISWKELVLKGSPLIGPPSYERRLDPSTWPPHVWLWLVFQDDSVRQSFCEHVPTKHKDAVELVFDWTIEYFPTTNS